MHDLTNHFRILIRRILTLTKKDTSNITLYVRSLRIIQITKTNILSDSRRQWKIKLSKINNKKKSVWGCDGK